MMTVADCVAERSTPKEFNLSYDDKGVPQRELTDFVVTVGDEKISICELDDRKAADGDVIARGSVMASSKALKVVSTPLIEWCIEYGQTPNLWIRSAEVWYRLTTPAKEYAKTHDLARRRFELCSRIFILWNEMSPKACTYKRFASLLSHPYQMMKGYSERELLMEKDFILAQIKSLNDPSMVQASFVKELRDKKVPSTKKIGSSVPKKSATASIGIGSGSGVTYLGPWVPGGKLDVDGNARLLRRAEKAVNQIYKSKNAWPFRDAVNPKTDGCPDYWQRIERPMDYGTIKKNFEKSAYLTAVEVAKDVRQVGGNCREYNGDQHEFSKWATELEHKFENLVRGGEDAELAAMNKRVASKKRKASEALPPSGKGVGKKTGLKVARKSSQSSSLDVSPSRDSSSRDEEPLIDKPCARTDPQVCSRAQVAGSKYCSDECGLIVARLRVAELTKAGYSVDEYIKARLAKSAVQSRG